MFLSVITVINIIIYHIVGIRHIHTQVRVQSRPFFTNEVQNLSFYTQRHTIIINRRHFKTLNYRFIHLLYECSTTTKPLYIKNMFKHVTFTFVAFKILGNDALNDTWMEIRYFSQRKTKINVLPYRAREKRHLISTKSVNINLLKIFSVHMQKINYV